jgi:hypothetical protein
MGRIHPRFEKIKKLNLKTTLKSTKYENKFI